MRERHTIIQRTGEGVRRQILRRLITDRDFTIISNNCWGPHLYRRLGIPYRTPFVGVSIFPDCYLRLLSRLRWYLAHPLVFRTKSRYDDVNATRDRYSLCYPIGCLADEIEIRFMHYRSEKEAHDKWSRRIARVVTADDRLFIKFCDADGASAAQLTCFDDLPFQHKVCFVSAAAPHLRCAVVIRDSVHGRVPGAAQLMVISSRYFDAAAWLNGGRCSLGSRLFRWA